MQETVANVIIPPLFDTILQDYASSVPDGREPKVLSLLSITIFSLREKFDKYLERMFELVFMPTLEMIKEDTSLYPEHRVNFFPLLDAAIRNCFQFVINLPENLLTLIVQAVLWSLQHTIRSVSELGNLK